MSLLGNNRRGKVGLAAIEMLQPVTVATYADAVPLFTGDRLKRINVLSDSVYNDGEPEFYIYDPVLGVAQRGIDFNYTE